MAQHPEMYTSEELQKFAISTKIVPSELASPAEGAQSMSPEMSMSSLALAPGSPEPAELEARDKATREMQYQQEVAAYYGGEGDGEDEQEHPAHRHDPQDRPDSRSRDPIPSQCETVFEEEEDSSSAYSGQEVRYAQVATSPTTIHVRSPTRTTIESVVSMYSSKQRDSNC